MNMGLKYKDYLLLYTISMGYYIVNISKGSWACYTYSPLGETND